MGAGTKQKYFINRQEHLTIRCQACGKETTFPVEQLRDRRHAFKVNCTCAESFDIELEYRKDFRKKTEIAGTVRPVSMPKQLAKRCTIADHSSGGLRLHLLDPVAVQKNDKLIVSYPPDNSSTTEIERVIAVRHLETGSRIGGAFVDERSKRMAPEGGVH